MQEKVAIGSDDAPEKPTERTRISRHRRTAIIVLLCRERKRDKSISEMVIVIYSNGERERKRRWEIRIYRAIRKFSIISVSLTFRRHRYGRMYSEPSDVDMDEIGDYFCIDAT